MSLFSNFLNIGQTLSSAASAFGDDVLNVKKALGGLGFYKTPDFGRTPYPDSDLFDGLKSFQKSNGLKPDGMMKPDGPTETGLNKSLLNSGIGNKLFQHEPGRSPLHWPSGRSGAESVTPKLIMPLPERQKLPEQSFPVSSESTASNRRTVDAMMKSSDDGDLPHLFADSLGTTKPKAVSEYGDFMGQLRERDPDRAARFEKAVMDKLPEASRARLAQMTGSVDNIPKPAGDLTGSSKNDTINNPKEKASGGSNIGTDGVFERFRERLAPREGGYAERPESADPGGPTQKGISQKILNTLRAKSDWQHLPANSKDLSDEQINNVYRKEFFDKPQINKLHAVPGLKEAAQKLAEQVFDAGVLHGPEDAGKWLQQSLDKELGVDSRTSAPDGSKIYDGIIGTKTRKALSQAVRQGKISAVNNGIVDRRKAYMQTRSSFSANKGWIPRAESFRMKQGK